MEKSDSGRQKVSKLKKTVVKIIICVLVALGLSAVLVACNNTGSTIHYDYTVTFDYNEGKTGEDFNIVAQPIAKQYIGVDKNSLVGVRPGGDNAIKETTIQRYYVDGWYLAKYDENGEPVKNPDTGVVQLDREWDFDNDRVNENITLYANLKKQAGLIFVDRATGEPVGGENGERYRVPGTEMSEPSSALQPSKSGYTFLGKYYESNDSDKEFDWPHIFGTEDTYVYVDFIEGEGWRFIDTVEDFISAMKDGANIYLRADLDLSDIPNDSLWARSTYNGNFNGNNHTVKGVHRTVQMIRGSATVVGAIFYGLGNRAYIYDVTFEDITLDHSVSLLAFGAKPYVGLLAGSAEENARIENVKIISGSLAYQTESNNGSITIIGNEFIADNRCENIENSGATNVTVTIK